MNIIKLKSVSTAIDTDTLKTYAINVDDTIDYNTCVYLDDCCNDWWANLSIIDRVMVNAILFPKRS